MENNIEWIQYSNNTPDDDDCMNFLTNVLPQWDTKVISITLNSTTGLVEVRFLIAAKDEGQIKTWLEEFQEKSKTTYSINSTSQCTGRYVEFKQRLYCHRNTRHTFNKNRTKNTNCPSVMTITLHAVKKRYKGKNKDNAPDPKMPCEIRLVTTHNHTINTADALRFRKVSDCTKNSLLQLYRNGHTPATALEAIKLDIHLQHENIETALADRKFCPSYNYCHYVYREEFKKKYEPLDFNKSENEVEIIYIENNINENVNGNNCPNNENNLQEGKELIENISDTMNKYLQSSTDEVLPALKLFNNRLTDIKTKAEFISSLCSFATEYHLKGIPTAISIRKTTLSGKNSHVGERPRKSAKIITKAKKSHKLSERVKHYLKTTSNHN